MTVRIPNGPELQQIRRDLGLTCAGMADFIGFDPKAGADTIRFLETGAKGGKPYMMSGAAAKSLWRGIAMRRAMELIREDRGMTAGAILMAAL